MKQNNNNNNNYVQHSASFATRRFSTLKTFSGHLEDIVGHKNTQYQRVIVYLNVSVYISRDLSSLVAIEMYGWPFFSVPCILSTTLLSDAIPTLRVLPYSDKII